MEVRLRIRFTRTKLIKMVFLSKGEELVSSGFVALIIYLFIDINIGIYRTFKKRQGLYYWSMLLGTLGCAIDTIAVILKYFLPNQKNLWPVYLLLILGGWTIYAPAQLLVLYSRLHLVNRDPRLQKLALIMVTVVPALLIIPSWVFDWPAWDPNSNLSALYSPREAIMDRVSQIGYTLAETVLSGIYIWRLTELLRHKSTVRQRRVMMDLIYANVIAILLDVVTVCLVFRNKGGISHPVQTFSYLLKLKLEFLVLNQLMAVAARGLRKGTFAEKRYHYPSFSDRNKSSDSRFWASKWALGTSKSNDDDAETMILPPSLPKAHRSSNDSNPRVGQQTTRASLSPMKADFATSNVRRVGAKLEDIDDDDIGVHMWERHHGSGVEVPWFRGDGQA